MKKTNPRFVISNSRFLIGICSLLCLASSTSASSPGFDTLVNYDTAWTYVYDGGSKLDLLYDVKVLPNGTSVCAGESGDTITGMANTVLIKFDASGHVLQKKLYNTNNQQESSYNSQYARSIVIAKNGDFIIGGVRYVSPYVMRTDSLGNLKWATWLYDSVNNRQSLLSRGATINCVRETSRGTIICAAGDYFTDASYAYGSVKNNYTVYLEFDSAGKIVKGNQWDNLAGYNLGGFDIEETQGGDYLLSGNQTVLDLDTSGHIKWNNAYTFSLNGVGSEINNITRCKVIRGNIPIVAGQAYEGNCWTNFKKLFYDAWWSPVDYLDGGNTTWDTAGYQGGDDRLNDFTQLVNGNLVFVGKKNSSNSQTSGMWAYVTPDSGSHILWENVVAGALYGGEPLSVCATPDSGFTVVGKAGGNAFAAHFIPMPVSAVVSRSNSLVKSSFAFDVHTIGSRLIVAGNVPNMAKAEAALFDITGRCVASKTGSKEISFDISKLSHGTYVVRVKAGSTVQTTKFIKEY